MTTTAINAVDAADDIDEAEVARILGGCSVSSVQRWAREGKIPSYKIGALRRYRRSSILAHIAKLEAAEQQRASATKRDLLGMRRIK